MSTIYLKNWKLKMMLSNFRMTLVLYEANENTPLILNADKTEMLFCKKRTNSDPKFTYKGEIIKPVNA